MRPSAFLDSSFLISFVDRERKHHFVAMEYFHFLVRQRIPIFLSTIVAAEFGLGQPITDLPLNYFQILPFNLVHAMKAADFDFKKTRFPGDRREIVKEDMKILAQACVEKITHLLTEDAQTLSRYGERLFAEGRLSTRTIKLIDGFLPSRFSEQKEA